jgi:hypothetical protein
MLEFDDLAIDVASLLALQDDRRLVGHIGQKNDRCDHENENEQARQSDGRGAP